MGRRHKVYNFLACDDCLRRITYGPGRSFWSRLGGFFSDMWGWLSDTVRGVFAADRQKQDRRAFSSQVKVAMKANFTDVRNVPMNPMKVFPQKR